MGERDKGAGSIFFLLLLSLLLISRFRSFCYNLAEQIFRNWHFVSFGRGGGAERRTAQEKENSPESKGEVEGGEKHFFIRLFFPIPHDGRRRRRI